MTSTNPKLMPIDLKHDVDEINICRNLFRTLVSYLEKFKSQGIEGYMFWAVRGHRPPAGGVLTMPTEGVDTWYAPYAPHGHTGMADKDSKLL